MTTTGPHPRRPRVCGVITSVVALLGVGIAASALSGNVPTHLSSARSIPLALIAPSVLADRGGSAVATTATRMALAQRVVAVVHALDGSWWLAALSAGSALPTALAFAKTVRACTIG